MGYSADKSPLIGHFAGPTRRLEPLGAQRQEKGGPNHLTREGLHATTPRTACQATGVPTRFLHDCRRTAAPRTAPPLRLVRRTTA